MSETNGEAESGADADSEPASDGGTPDEADAGGPDEPDTDDQTPPEVELGLYQINVTVRGTGDDDLNDVETTARGLIEHLVDQAKQLEDEPDGRGLG